MCVYIYIYVYTYRSMYVYIYIYIYNGIVCQPTHATVLLWESTSDIVIMSVFANQLTLLCS